MSSTRISRGFLLFALVLAIGACGGGSSGGGTAAAPESPVPEVGGAEVDSPLTQVVIRYDVNGDDNPDLLTLDRTTDPVTIVEALVSTDSGESVDRTREFKGRTIDPEVSRMLVSYLSDSLEVASETRLDVVESGGRETTITIYE